MKKMFLVVFLISPLNAYTDCWPSNDIIAGIAISSNAAILADWGQTRHIADNPESFYEKNSDLGPHPTRGEVNKYFAKRLIGINVVGCALGLIESDMMQTLFWASQLVYNVDVVHDNYQIGVKIDF